MQLCRVIQTVQPVLFLFFFWYSVLVAVSRQGGDIYIHGEVSRCPVNGSTCEREIPVRSALEGAYLLVFSTYLHNICQKDQVHENGVAWTLINHYKDKGKPIPVQAREDPESSMNLSLPDLTASCT